MPALHDDERSHDERTRIPMHVESEDPFLSVAELKVSLRQMLTLFMSLIPWWIAAKITVAFLPVGFMFAGILWSWVILGGVLLAFKKKDGVPYEQYLSERIVFAISTRHFIARDPSASKRDRIEDADWEELDE